MASNGENDKSLIVSFGEMLIDFVPTVSGVSLAEAPGFLKAPGGAPANVAIAVARLGGKAAFVGKLGLLSRSLPYALMESVSFMFYRNPSADMLLRPEELNLELIRSAKVFHYGSISLIVEPCRSAHLEAMRVAKRAGALLSYDPNLRLPLWPSAEEAREQILKIWDEADVIKVSDVELEFLTGSDKIDDETALTLWRPNFKLLLVTLGENGCKYYTKFESHGIYEMKYYLNRKNKESCLLFLHPPPTEDTDAPRTGAGVLPNAFHGTVDAFHVKTIDTTGAGDSFIGALLCKIVDDQSVLEDEPKLREILRFANACGAITTTKKGAIPALPSPDEVHKLLNAEK
ncbi:hypothetical protein OIU76_025291 [Salix suchowensis]|nr:hypothetical protein OIU76_025291 [Salix suchowensis]